MCLLESQDPLPCFPTVHRGNFFPAAPKPPGFSSRSVMWLPGPSPYWGQHRPAGLFGLEAVENRRVTQQDALGLGTGLRDPSPPSALDISGPVHMPHIMPPSPWGSQTFLGLPMGVPQKASIVVWQMRERTALCCRSSPLLPLPRGRPPGPSAGPKPGEKHGRGPLVS